MNIKFGFVLLCLALLVSGCTTVKKDPTALPKGVVVNKSVQVPNPVKLRYYIPKSSLNSRFFASWRGLWVNPGQGLAQGVDAAFKSHFSDSALAQFNANDDYALLVALAPEWKPESGVLNFQLNYKVFDTKGKLLMEGKETDKADIGDIAQTAAFFNTALKTAQVISVKVLNTLKPSLSGFPELAKIDQVAKEAIADMKKPVSTGTGFFINKDGQILTAAHVLDDCLVTKATFGQKDSYATLSANSTLLDTAVLNSEFTQVPYLPLREGDETVVGEPVANVGYPLQGVLAQSANLTRGNVSAAEGIPGSMGHLQFSAPIQPGSSGGPIVSDGGELLGMAVSTLNVTNLIEKGIVPQNVNFALKRQHIRRFLDKHQIAYSSSKPNFSADFRTGNDAALATVVKLSCYQ
ncbi:serine protease [Rheinheimera sediminis]|uniref:S1 family peptidase n=1 Tax=Rheinheimera sp. YQF-1 TaxID=2499626 RepID=UPI000FDC8963|nr:serine protease [Rheinheimera sp. YQF-1]RVT46302.1 serine protease [Rheinheimera sp. YQF-1]